MKLKFSVLTFFFVFISSLAFSENNSSDIFVQPGLSTSQKKNAVEGEILVKFKESAGPDKILEKNTRRGTVSLSINKKLNVYRLRVPKGSSVSETIAAYQSDPDVVYAEPNSRVQAHFVPNDPYYRYQWNFDDSFVPNPYGGANGGGINLEPAWDVTQGSPSVVVAVVDTGVAYENYGTKYALAPDLANTKFVAGYDFIEADTHPNDANGHGTHVTGTIAQSTNNALGTAGIAFNVSIMPVRVLDANGSGTTQTVADGIVFAADHGAKVINMSLGSSAGAQTLESAVAYAYNKGVTIIASSGNDNGAVSYPAAYDNYVIAVGATRYDETRSPYSNFGPQLDIVAPGGDTNVDQNGDGYADGILQQTFPQGRPKQFGYYFFQGTSMSSPHVTGVAALLISKGVVGPDKVREALQKSAEDKGAAGRDDIYGSGLLDAKASLAYQPNPVHDLAVTGVTAPSSALQGNVVSVQAVVENFGDFSENATVRLLDQTDNVEISNQTVSLAAKAKATLSFSWDTTQYSVGSHSLKASADTVAGETNTSNNSSTAAITLSQPVHDLATVALDVPASVTRGDVVIVKLTVENQGTYQETSAVTFSDLTEGLVLGSQNVTLAIGEQKLVSFNWDTASSGLGTHTLEGKIAPVTGESDTADNVLTNTSEVKQPVVNPKMHVGDITLSFVRKGQSYEVRAKVTVLDEPNQPVSGAVARGDFAMNGVSLNSATGTTLSDGTVILASNRVRPVPGDVFTFAVQSVSKSGYQYDVASNTETSDSIVF